MNTKPAATAPAPAVLFARLLARGRLRHLQLLAAVAEQGSLKRAAEQVAMSQPAATQALTDLENLLNAPLFERHARGMRPTAYGRAVIPVARNVLQALRASAETLSALQQGAHGLLRVGTIPAASSGVLSDMLMDFCGRDPNTRIEVHEDRGDHLVAELVSGGLDLVLCRRPVDLPARLSFQLLRKDEAVVLAGVGHPLARRQHLRIEDLDDALWMRAPPGMKVRDVFEQLFGQRERRPRIHPLSTTSEVLLLEALRHNQVLSLVPSSLARAFRAAGQVTHLDLTLDAAFDGIGVLTSSDTADSPVTAAFIEALQAGAASASAAPGARGGDPER